MSFIPSWGRLGSWFGTSASQSQTAPVDSDKTTSGSKEPDKVTGADLRLEASDSDPQSGKASQVHFQRMGGSSEPLSFWNYTSDGLGKTELTASDATAQEIGKQVAVIIDRIKAKDAYKDLTFKSINFTKALITFVDADGIEHTIPLNHDDYPLLEEINKIIARDTDFVAQFNFHGFHHYARNQKGNTRADNGLIGTLTPRLKENASEDLDVAADKRKIPKEHENAKKRADELIHAKRNAINDLIKKTEEEIEEANKKNPSQVLGLQAKLEKLKKLQADVEPDYDALAFCLEKGFIDPSLPRDQQVQLARAFKQELLEYVAKLPGGNPHASEWVQHDKQFGQTHTHFKGVRDFFGFTQKGILDLEDRRITAIVGMLIGSPEDRRAFCEFMKGEGREIESDPAEYAFLRFAFDDDFDSDDIRDGDLHIISVDDPLLQRELQQAIADALDDVLDASDSVASKASDADGDKLDIDDKELDDLEKPELNFGEDHEKPASFKDLDFWKDKGKAEAAEDADDVDISGIISSGRSPVPAYDSLPYLIKQSIEELSSTSRMTPVTYFNSNKTKNKFWKEVRKHAKIPHVAQNSLDDVHAHYAKRNEKFYQLIGFIDGGDEILREINRKAPKELDPLARAKAIEDWMQDGNNAEMLIKVVSERVHKEGGSESTVRFLTDICEELDIDISEELMASINDYFQVRNVAQASSYIPPEFQIG